MHAAFGYLHARAAQALGALGRERGQGTVEYVGLILLIAVVLAGVVKGAGKFSDDNGIASTIVSKLKDAISGVGGK